MLKKAETQYCDCYHCGLPVTAANAFYAELGGARRTFCCPACRAVASTIIESGLGSYYRHFLPSGEAVAPALVAEDFSSFDDNEWQRRHVVVRDETGGQSASVQLLLEGIHCAACVWLLEKYLSALPGVMSVSASLNDSLATLRWRPAQLKLSVICRAIASLGYQPHFYTPDQRALLQQQENHLALRRLGVAGLAMMQVGMFAIALYAGALQGIEDIYRDYLRWVSLLVATPVVFYSAKPFFLGAWRGIKSRAPGMDLPVALAIGLAYAASLKATVGGGGEVYFDSVAMFTFLLLAGRYLEMRARHRNGRMSSDLFSLLPSTAVRLCPGDGPQQDGEVLSQRQETVPLFKIAVGDRLLIKPGQVIPVDGAVTRGEGWVNEAQLTGEFMPRHKRVGDEVIAGTVNERGVLTVLAHAVGADLKLQAINQLMTQAQRDKPRIAQLADRYASVFVVLVLLLAAVTFIGWQWSSGGAHAGEAFWITLSVLVVSCPCALSLATPTAMTTATHYLRRFGLLVTNAQVWEKVAGITDVICDKTGTLTRGALSVSTTLPMNGFGEEECLRLAAALESHSEHPIAKAFETEKTLLPAATAVVVHAGRGVEAIIRGKRHRIGKPDYAQALCGSEIPPPRHPGQWVLLSNEDQPLCWFRLQDTLRDDTSVFVDTMRRRRLRLHLLSGDNVDTVRQLAEQLHFDVYRADASPEDKLQYVRALQREGRQVLMLGDGLNDIPVLAAADISVAMANASNLAKTQADAICLSAQLSSVVRLLELAARTRSVIRQNIAWALAYNLSAIPLAALGWVPPWLAALGMSLSSLVVVLNALRLRKEPAGETATLATLKPGLVNG